jgi:hypothetical protein
MARHQPRIEDAETARLALDRYLEAARGDARPRDFGLTRRIAFIALHAIQTGGVTLKEALDLAGALYDGDGNLTETYFRKCKSEARALVEALVAKGAAQNRSESTDATFRDSTQVLLDISIAEVTRRRAEMLDGARGGPKARRAMVVLAAVRRLERRARSGDRHATAELESIRTDLDANAKSR